MTFRAGQAANPTGKNGLLKGYQRYSDRAVYLMQQYTVGQILDLASNEQEFKKLPVRDGQIIKQLATTLIGLDARQEREALLDRIEGKADAKLTITGDITHNHKPVSYTAEWLAESLGRGPAEPPEKPVLN